MLCFGLSGILRYFLVLQNLLEPLLKNLEIHEGLSFGCSNCHSLLSLLIGVVDKLLVIGTITLISIYEERIYFYFIIALQMEGTISLYSLIIDFSNSN